MKNPHSVEFDSMMQHSNYEVIFMETPKRLNADGRIQTGKPHSSKPNALPTELTSPSLKFNTVWCKSLKVRDGANF